MNDYKLFPTFLLVSILLVSVVIAAPQGETSITIGTPQSGGVSGGNTTLKANGASCSAASECTGGYCNSGTCASSAPSTTGTTGSTGTGGTTTGGTTVVTETKTINTIYANTPQTVTLTQISDLKIEKIEIKTNVAVSSAEVTVKESSSGSLPTGATAPLTSDKGTVLKYLEIVKSNIPDTSVDKIKIEFRVEKSWVTSNNIATSTIALQRLVGTTWNKLNTTLKEETATLYKFEAESPGLSYFAITGEKKAAIQAACPDAFECCVGEVNYTDKACDSGYECKNNICSQITVPCTENWDCTAWSKCVEETQTRTCTDLNSCGTTVNKPAETQTCETPKIPLWIWIIFAVIIIIVAFTLMKKR